MFTKIAERINEKIEKGLIDPTNESSGVRVGTGNAGSIPNTKKVHLKLTDNNKEKNNKKCC